MASKKKDQERAYKDAQGAQQLYSDCVTALTEKNTNKFLELIERYLNETAVAGSGAGQDQRGAVIQEIFQSYQSEGKTLIHIAASTGNESAIQYALSQALDTSTLVNLVDEHGFTPLMNATIGESPELMKLLLSHGAEVNQRNNDGASALHFAAGDGSLERMSLLVEAGGDVTLASESGSPLSWAAGNGRADAIRYLAQRGCSCETVGSLGIPPIFMAAVAPSEESVVALIENGADAGYLITGNLTVLHICAEHGMTNAVEAILTTPTGLKTAQQENSDGNKPIHLAAMGSHEAIIRALFPHSGELDSSFSQTDESGERILNLEAILADGKRRLELWIEQHSKKSSPHASSSHPPPPRAVTSSSPSSDASPLPTLSSPLTPEQLAESDSHKTLGNQHFARKDYELALAEYSQALDSNPVSHVLYSNRSACYLSLAAAASADPQLAKSYRLKALQDAEICRRLEPSWVKGCFRLAIARYELEMYEDAAVAAYEGCQLDDENHELKSLLQKAVKKGQEQYQRAKAAK
jgi:ankyrin repeat protein